MANTKWLKSSTLYNILSNWLAWFVLLSGVVSYISGTVYNLWESEIIKAVSNFIVIGTILSIVIIFIKLLDEEFYRLEQVNELANEIKDIKSNTQNIPALEAVLKDINESLPSIASTLDTISKDINSDIIDHMVITDSNSNKSYLILLFKIDNCVERRYKLNIYSKDIGKLHFQEKRLNDIKCNKIEIKDINNRDITSSYSSKEFPVKKGLSIVIIEITVRDATEVVKINIDLYDDENRHIIDKAEHTLM